MASSNGFLRAFNVVLPLRDFVYLLQLEEYETKEYVGRLRRFFFRRGLERRDTLKWTVRAMAVALTVIGLFGTITISVGLVLQSVVASVVAFVTCAIAMPLVVLLASIMTTPIFVAGRAFVWRKGARHVATMSKLKIVVVAGSHGKTTTKNLVYDMIRFSCRTQLIGGNINTTTGIAQWVLKNLQPATEVLIVEMDAYHPGEIRASCRITPPDISVLTSIGDQHLLRFGSREAITRGLAEAFVSLKANLIRICGSETAVTIREAGIAQEMRVVDEPTYRGIALPCENMSASVKEDVAYAAAVADVLDAPSRFVEDACRSFTPPDRRQKPATVFGYEGIDDSYNISQTTARAGVEAAKTLARTLGKKLVVLTAGIPELPRGLDRQVNTEYGAFLSQHADAVVVLLSEFADAVRKGLGSIEPETARDMKEAVHVLHSSFSQEEYVLLFQSELTDASY